MAKKLSQTQIRNVSGDEKEDFLLFKKKLGFAEDSHFYSFCASISFYKLDKKKLNYVHLTNGDNAFNAATTIPDVHLFEILIDNYYSDGRDEQKKIFENLSYSGFLVVKEWWTSQGQNEKNELERFMSLMKYIQEN